MNKVKIKFSYPKLELQEVIGLEKYFKLEDVLKKLFICIIQKEHGGIGALMMVMTSRQMTKNHSKFILQKQEHMQDITGLNI
jgi:hypothetical protein